jgi:hypothetical protein
MTQANSVSESTKQARQDGYAMAMLYQTNRGGLDAFYRLLASYERKHQGEYKRAFQDAFFDTIEVMNQGGTDE